MPVATAVATIGCAARAKPLPGAADRRAGAAGDRDRYAAWRVLAAVERDCILGSPRTGGASQPNRTIGAMDSKRPALVEREARWPGQLAAIDMGSNSFRLEIGQLQSTAATGASTT